MKAVTHLEKVIAGETSAVTHLEKVIAQETTAVTYTEKVIAGTAPPVTHLQKVIAGVANPATHLEYVWAGGSPPSEQEYTGAVPVTFVADGTPLLDFLISGNAVQSGTPTPDSPVMPEGTGELETNLAIISGDSKTLENTYYADVRVTDVLEAGTYTILYVIDEKTGNASTSSVGFGTRYAYQKDIKSFTVSNVPATITVTVTLDSEGCLWARFLRSGSPTDFSYSVSHVRVEKGSHSYGYKIPISSANTTTPVYLGEVETTRKIKKLVLTGEEFVYVYANADIAFRINTSDTMLNYRYCVCTHFPYQRTPGHSTIDGVTAGAGDYNLYFTFSSSSAAQFGVVAGDTNSFKAYLAQQYAAGTPVTIWYVLAEPETGIVNEPLMKIGDYADTLSMEHAGVSIPTANGSTTLDVETTVKPSEVYIKYRGEAAATLSALPAEVSSPEANEEVNPEETEEEENGSEDVSLQYKPEAIE